MIRKRCFDTAYAIDELESSVSSPVVTAASIGGALKFRESTFSRRVRAVSRGETANNGYETFISVGE